MKKLVNTIAIMAVAALTFASCQKEINTENVAQDGIEVTITAGNPITKTVLGEDGTTPYWKDGDALSVTNGTTSNVKFEENNIAEGETSAIAEFSGKVSAAGDFYAVYPHTTTTATTNNGGGFGPRVTVPIEQHPTAKSFDGDADIMVSKMFTVSGTTTTTVNNLQFARCGAILKIVLSGKTTTQQNQLANQHPVSISLTANNDLVGNVVFDYENATASIYSTPSKTVSATYTNSTNYLIDGVNAAYLVVVPTTLTGSIDITAITEDYEIARTLTLPADGIKLEAGKIYTFNVSLGANSITEATPAQALPWSHDFSWHTTTSETNYVSSITTLSNGEWSAGTYVYGAKEAGAIRIGSSSNPGSITSKLINLSSGFKVTVSAKAYNTGDNAKVTVTVGDVTKTASNNLGSSYVDYEFDFDAGDGTSKSSIIIGTSQKRAVITSVSVESATPTVSVPTFSPEAGAVKVGTIVSINCSTEGSTIHFTTDGSTPTSDSPIYSSAITINESMTIKAIAVKDGLADSSVATAEYVALEGSGTEQDPYTVSDILIKYANSGSGDEAIYVTGIITDIAELSTAYGNATYTISEGEKSILVYRGKYLDNKAFTDANQISEHDIVVVYGKVSIYNNAPQLASGNYLVSIQKDSNAPKLSISPETTSDNPAIWPADNNDVKTFTITATNGTWSVSDDSTVSSWANVSNSGTIITVTPKDKQASSAHRGSLTITLTPSHSGYSNLTETIYLAQDKYTESGGGSYSLTPDQASTGSSATSYITTLTEFEYDGIYWKMNQWNPSSLQIRTNQSSAASEFRFYNTSAFSGRISKVVITFSALTVSDASKLMFIGGTSAVTATTGGTAGVWDSESKTLTWTPSASDSFTYFAFYQDGKAASGSNYLANTDAIVVTYE